MNLMNADRIFATWVFANFLSIGTLDIQVATHVSSSETCFSMLSMVNSSCLFSASKHSISFKASMFSISRLSFFFRSSSILSSFSRVIFLISSQWASFFSPFSPMILRSCFKSASETALASCKNSFSLRSSST
uniref:Uncharacterized protein n=1 Tax=Opuntia streptacantha TaxID=393608 RepID=A0A7C9DQ64_OPUST